MAVLAVMAGNFYSKKKEKEDAHLKSGMCADGKHNDIKNRKTKIFSMYIQTGIRGSRECFPGRILWLGLVWVLLVHYLP